MHSTRFTFREYIKLDQPSCLEIFNSNCPTYFSQNEQKEFIEWLEKYNRPSYSVLEENGKVIACGGIFYDSALNSAGLAWGMVHNDRHGQGIGLHLTQFRLAQIEDTFPGLEQNLRTSQYTYRFYEKLGFEVQKVMTNGFSKGLDLYEMMRYPRS